MERRTFLKILGLGIGATATYSPVLKLVEAFLPQEYFVREMVGFDGESDMMYVRYDVSNGIKQFHVAMPLYDDTQNISKYREAALQALNRLIKRHNWTLADLKPLPIPRGCRGQYIQNYL